MFKNEKSYNNKMVSVEDEVFISYGIKGGEKISISWHNQNGSNKFLIVDFIDNTTFTTIEVDYQTKKGLKRDIFNTTNEIDKNKIIKKLIEDFTRGQIMYV